jgi:hypothetical protein
VSIVCVHGAGEPGGYPLHRGAKLPEEPAAYWLGRQCFGSENGKGHGAALRPSSQLPQRHDRFLVGAGEVQLDVGDSAESDRDRQPACGRIKCEN